MKKILVMLAIAGLVVFGAASPAQANVSYCYAHSICAYPSLTTWPAGSPTVINRDVADAPRNTCFADFGSQQTYTLINNSAYRWYYFRTSACTGSHLEIPPYTELHVPSGWESIHGWFRTSLTS